MMLLADLAIRSSIVLLLGLGLRALLRRRSAALRHRVLATALFASASVAPLTLILPAWSMPAGRPPTAMVMAIETVRASPAAPIETRTLPSPAQWAALVWSAGLVAGVVTLALGIRRLKRIGARAHRVGDSKWTALVHRISRAYGLKRSVVLLQTNEPTVLATWGLRPSRVLLPIHAREWTDDRAYTVLCHELAHIQRSDWLVQICAEIVRIVYWFNPLMWIACARLRFDSELACDDVVLGEGVAADSYAGHLLELARICRPPSRTWASAMLMARPSALERRITAMLKADVSRETPSRSAFAATIVMLLAVALPTAAYRAAQTSPLPLKGVVYDSTGGVVPDVEVTLVDENQAKTKVLTGADGLFQFTSIAPGPYVLEASLPGFRALRQDIELRTARDWDRAITLGVGDLRETINVRARRPAPGPPSSQPSVAPRAIAVGGNIRAPRKLVDVKPVYPATMRDAGREGVVPIEAIIGRDGSVTSLRVVSAQVHPDFAIAAVDAVRQWRFDPTLLNGEPVEVVMTVSVTFSLGD